MPHKPSSTASTTLANQLRCHDVKKLLPALRGVKNQIIGNRAKKAAYTRFGVLASVLEVFSKHEDPQVLLEAAVALSSFAYNNPDGLSEILSLNGVQHFVRALSSKDERLVQANLRALKNIYKDPAAPRGLLQNQETLFRLVSFLGDPESPLAEYAASLLAECCSSQDEKKALAAAGAVDALQRLLSSPRRKTQEAAAEALAGVSAGSEEVGAALLASPGLLDDLAGRCRDCDPRLRLTACSTLAHVTRCKHPEDAALQRKVVEAAKGALLVLIQLLSDASLRQQVPPLLALLLSNSDSLIDTASDTDAVRQLSSFLSDASSSPDATRAGALAALASLCMASERCRRQLSEARGLPCITSHLEDDNAEIRAQAALCARALSRPTRHARGSLLEAGALRSLVRLASDPSTEVQVQAVGAITNMVMDKAAAEEVVAGEGLPALVRLLDSMDCALRRQATWAITNLSTHAGDVQRQLLAALPWSTAKELLSDPEPGVQLHALALVRNLAKAPGALMSGVMEWAGGELLQLLEARLQPSFTPRDREALENTLYAVSNLATNSGMRDAIMATSIPSLLPSYLTRANPPSTLLPVTWCIINLSWAEEDSEAEATTGAAARRVGALTEIGLPGVLRGLLEHVSCQNVRERVKTALEQLKL